MKWKPVSSRYRYCISRFSRMATSTGSSARKVLSRVRPVRTFFSRVRTKAPPLPGLTCWNSTTFIRLPSRLRVMPFLRSLVVAMASPYQVPVDHLGQHRQRDPAGAEHQIVEAAQVEADPEAGLGEAPEPDQLQAPDHVSQGLAGHGDVAVDLVLDVAAGQGGVGQQVPDGLVAAPAELVQPGVDDQPAGPPGVERQHAEAFQVARVEAELVGQPLGVQGPALAEGGDVAEAPEPGQLLQLLGQGELEVVAGDALVEGQGLVLVAGAGLGGRGVEPVDPGGAAVGGRRLVVAEHGVPGLI